MKLRDKIIALFLAFLMLGTVLIGFVSSCS